MQSDQKDAMIESLVESMKPQLKESIFGILKGASVTVSEFSLELPVGRVKYRMIIAHELTGIVLKSVLDGMQLAEQRGTEIQQQQSKLVRPS